MKSDFRKAILVTIGGLACMFALVIWLSGGFDRHAPQTLFPESRSLTSQTITLKTAVAGSHAVAIKQVDLTTYNGFPGLATALRANTLRQVEHPEQAIELFEIIRRDAVSGPLHPEQINGKTVRPGVDGQFVLRIELDNDIYFLFADGAHNSEGSWVRVRVGAANDANPNHLHDFNSFALRSWLDHNGFVPRFGKPSGRTVN